MPRDNGVGKPGAKARAPGMCKGRPRLGARKGTVARHPGLGELAAPRGFFLLLLATALELGRGARHSSAGVAAPSRARRVGGPAWSSRRGRRDGVEEKSEDTTQTSG